MASIVACVFDNGPSSTNITAFSMAKYEVTEGLWREVMGLAPLASGVDETYPATNVNWYDACDFCNRLTQELGGTEVCTISDAVRSNGHIISVTSITADWTDSGYRLPTEGEWEWAARGGTSTAYCWGDNLADQGPYVSATKGPVGQKLPNAYGVYDTAGNAADWVWDWHEPWSIIPPLYPTTILFDPTGPASGTDKMLRDGLWMNGLANPASTARDYHYPPTSLIGIGFRVAKRP